MQRPTEAKSSGVGLTRHPFSAHAPLPAAWQEIYDRLPNASFFLSPDWTATWIETYGPSFEGEYLIWHQEGEPVAAVLLLLRPAKFGPFNVRLAVINTGAEAGADGVYLEHNDVLCLNGARDAVRDSLVETLGSYSWDQLVLCGYSPGSLLADIADRLGSGQEITKRAASPFVDLAKARQAGLLAVLSKNTRSQIRRSMELYEERGPVKLTMAASITEAHQLLDQLRKLHQSLWNKRGQLGAFNSDRFADFHHRLIDRAWNKDQIHLANITAGDSCIGVIYCLYGRGNAYFYQSGFVYEQDNRLKPGLVCHALMIDWYARHGAHEYDFLAGDSRYKRSLATDTRDLLWSTLDRSSLKMGLLRWLSNRKTPRKI